MRSELPKQKVILTSEGRLLQLPVSADEIKSTETVVATNVNVGLLYIREYKSDKKHSLHDRDELLLSDMSSTEYNVSFISLPLIEHYLAKKESLKSDSEKVRCDLDDKLKIVKGIEKKKR